MALSNLLRILGLSSFLGGLMIGLVQPWFYYDPGSFSASFIEYVGYILILLGIIGLYLAQFNEINNFGLLVFVFVLISHSLWLGYKWFITFVNADLIRSVPELVPSDLPATNYGADLSLYALLIGLTLFALPSLWKGKVSRIGSSLLLLGALGGITELIAEVIPFQLLIPHGVIGLSFAWLGWSLFYGKERAPIKTMPIIVENESALESAEEENDVTASIDMESDSQLETENAIEEEKEFVSEIKAEIDHEESNDTQYDSVENDDHSSDIQKGEKLGSTN